MTKITNNKNVSILTITQFKRFKCIKILFTMAGAAEASNYNAPGRLLAGARQDCG